MSADLLTQIETYSAQLNEAAPPVEQLADTATLEDRVVARGVGMTRGRRGWLVMVAAAVLVLIGIGLVPLLIRSMQETEPATVEEVIEGLNELTPADLPAVRLTLSFDPGAGYSADGVGPGRGVAEIIYVPDSGYRLEFIEGNEDNPTGTYLAWDGTWLGFVRVEPEGDVGPDGFRLLDSAPIYPPNWQTDFSDLCSAGNVELIGEEVVAGFAVVGLSCTQLRGEWDIWVDTETGLVLRLEGAYAVTGGEVDLVLAPDGSFEVIALAHNPEPAGSVFDVSALDEPSGDPMDEIDLSPFRALISMSVTTGEAGNGMETFEATIEVWYRASDAWQVSVVEGTGPQVGMMAVGSYEVQVSDTWGLSDPAGVGSFTEPRMPAFPELADRLVQVLVSDLDSSCGVPQSDEMIGRVVEIHACTVPGTNTQWTIAVDADTGLVLLDAWEFDEFEVMELDIGPNFPPEIMQLPVTSGIVLPRPLVGKSAPDLEVPLLDGAPFDLDDLEGQKAAVLFWGSWCLPCLDALEELQSAQDLLGQDIAFVAVAGPDERTPVSDIVKRGNLTVLIPFDEHGTSAQDWQIDGWPVLFLVNKEGVIIQRHPGSDYPGGLIEVLQEAIW